MLAPTGIADANAAFMLHSMPLITTIASALGLALVLGFIAIRIKLPALVGYLMAGVLIGPFTPGFVANTALASELAEIGVMLLMFGVGLHFSLDNLLDVRKIALPGAVLQIIVATALGASVGILWGWSVGASIVFGICLSVASTVVLLRALEAAGILETINGRIAVGWLIVEDLVMVLVLVLLPPLVGALGDSNSGSENTNIWLTLGTTLLKVSAFVVFMLLVGRRLFPALLWHVARTGSRELFTLCVIAAAVSIAYLATAIFGVSFALGAFFAGMVMRESEFSHRAAEESLPLREAFSVLFFVSVGMLFNPMVLVERPFQVFIVVAIIVVGKSLAAAAFVLALRYPLNTALTVSASLAQIGEFSFILASLGVNLKLLPPEAQSLILAGALISIAINPIVFAGIKPIQTWIKSNSKTISKIEIQSDHLSELPTSTPDRYLAGHVVLVGYGHLGQKIGKELIHFDIPFVVADDNREAVERLREKGIAAVTGNALDSNVLIQAHIAHASMLVIATPDTFDVRQVMQIARKLNDNIEVLVMSQQSDEAKLLEQEAFDKVFLVEDELAKNMSHYVLTRFGKSTKPIH